MYFTGRRVGRFTKSPILNLSSSSPPPSHFFLSMQLVSFNAKNSSCKTKEIFINERKALGYLSFTCIKPRFVEGCIIPSKCSFQTSFGANRCSRQLMATTQKRLCGYTVNIFGREDQNFQWSKEYSYYSSPSTHNEVIWTYGISRAGCVPEVFDCKEVVSWCVEKYISSQIIIPLWDHSHVSFSP
jgi:hypothetical protein